MRNLALLGLLILVSCSDPLYGISRTGYVNSDILNDNLKCVVGQLKKIPNVKDAGVIQPYAFNGSSTVLYRYTGDKEREVYSIVVYHEADVQKNTTLKFAHFYTVDFSSKAEKVIVTDEQFDGLVSKMKTVEDKIRTNCASSLSKDVEQETTLDIKD